MKKVITYCGFLIFSSLILMAGECKKDKVDNFDDCISAQKHYYEKLLIYGCTSTEPTDARSRVVSDCNGSKVDKADYLEDVCSEGGTPNYNCD
jgi:hypothetical protein